MKRRPARSALYIAAIVTALGGGALVMHASHAAPGSSAFASGATVAGQIEGLTQSATSSQGEAAFPDPEAHGGALASSLSLIRQLKASGDHDGLYRIVTLLASPNSPQGLPVARQLLSDRDPALRETGIDILTGHSLTDPEVHALALQTLHTEQDSQVLVHLLGKLDAPIDLYGKDAEMLGALHGLLASRSPDVRAQSMLQLLQWDEFGNLEGFVYQSLNDSSPAVRLSAATVIGLIDTRSETLKSALITLRDNPQESPDLRETAASAINRINLMQQDARNDARTAGL